jgi:hypothetical protein
LKLLRKLQHTAQVILSGAAGSRSEASAESKDPYQMEERRLRKGIRTGPIPEFPDALIGRSDEGDSSTARSFAPANKRFAQNDKVSIVSTTNDQGPTSATGNWQLGTDN